MRPRYDLPMNIAIHDEISQLESIIIHEPGNEMNRMHPVHLEGFRESDEGQLQPNPDYLLFDDLVYFVSELVYDRIFHITSNFLVRMQRTFLQKNFKNEPKLHFFRIVYYAPKA